ncbi:MAG TPA: hypothetical protein GXZ39_10440 [Bacteroidales bacterium]|jgi:hypothetical protein|nr:hypothetical protein [Bacteroidales bacterium]
MKHSTARDFRHITSFKQLSDERTRLSFEVRLSRKKLDMALMEFNEIFSPLRLAGTLAREWMKPLLGSIRRRIQDYISGKTQQNREK